MDTRFLIIGGGIAGASTGYFLAPHGETVLLERESQPGYHSTGRSAALFTEFYGNPIAGALAIASRSFLEAPPDGFADAPLMTPRGTLFLARPDQMETLERLLPEALRVCANAEKVDAARAVELCPCVDPGYVAAAIFEPDSKDMDVDAIHQGYLRGFRRAGGEVRTDAEVTAIGRDGNRWRVTTAAGDVTAETIVNAAGAWADAVAEMAGVAPLGLAPKRRTAMIFDPPDGQDPSGWASVIDIDEAFYWKPDAGKLLGSPADETPVPPQDVQPEEIDVAIAVDRIQRASTLEITRIEHKWAGLRSFFADKSPAVGPDPAEPAFIWCAGQGGFGIMTSPAMGRATAAAAAGLPLPPEIEAAGINREQLGPARLR
jgi:D-arginine dehydrogenase